MIVATFDTTRMVLQLAGPRELDALLSGDSPFRCASYKRYSKANHNLESLLASLGLSLSDERREAVDSCCVRIQINLHVPRWVRIEQRAVGDAAKGPAEMERPRVEQLAAF
jgi:hypothetical protein